MCPNVQHLASRNANCRQGTYTEAEFLDEIQTKVSRFFYLAIQNHLYSFLFLQTRTTPYSFFNSSLYTVKEKRKNRQKTTPPFLWFKKSKKSIQKPQKSGELSILCTETLKKLYVHEFCFSTRCSCCFLLAERGGINFENMYTLAQGTNYKMHLILLARQRCNTVEAPQSPPLELAIQEYRYFALEGGTTIATHHYLLYQWSNEFYKIYNAKLQASFFKGTVS